MLDREWNVRVQEQSKLAGEEKKNEKGGKFGSHLCSAVGLLYCITLVSYIISFILTYKLIYFNYRTTIVQLVALS